MRWLVGLIDDDIKYLITLIVIFLLNIFYFFIL